VNETYYRDHWIDIEPERFERYKRMFEWSDASRPLLEPAGIRPGEVVVDLGCGPGLTAFELATWVGPSGHVHGIEINADFVEFARAAATERGLEEAVTFHHVAGRNLPFSDGSIDCVVAKNVFVYVDDPLQTYQECRRVLRQGGRAHVVEGDWGLAFAEPVPDEDWKALIRAASFAFRTPSAGRQLYGYARAAGFTDVTVSVVCRPDTTGRLLPMVRNLCTYARQSRTLEDNKIDAVLSRCEEAAKSQKLLILNPQFVVTATR
jgi:ubiquinone/menaquinone biosynthesis C-methylase UbiE